MLKHTYKWYLENLSERVNSRSPWYQGWPGTVQTLFMKWKEKCVIKQFKTAKTDFPGILKPQYMAQTHSDFKIFLKTVIWAFNQENKKNSCQIFQYYMLILSIYYMKFKAIFTKFNVIYKIHFKNIK